MCGGSPKVCVLVEWKAGNRVTSEQLQLKMNLDQLFVQYKCTVKNRSLDLTLSDYPAGNTEYVQTTPAGHIPFGF